MAKWGSEVLSVVTRHNAPYLCEYNRSFCTWCSFCPWWISALLEIYSIDTDRYFWVFMRICKRFACDTIARVRLRTRCREKRKKNVKNLEIRETEDSSAFGNVNSVGCRYQMRLWSCLHSCMAGVLMVLTCNKRPTTTYKLLEFQFSKPLAAAA